MDTGKNAGSRNYFLGRIVNPFLVMKAAPAEWRPDEGASRALGDHWLDRTSSCLLRVPSVIVAVAEADDRNVVINHRHTDAAGIEVAATESFAYNRRLFRFRQTPIRRRP